MHDPALIPAVAVAGVTHRYGDRVALRDLSLRVEAGAQVALLGPNGSGKTTLFRILSTLMAPTEGTAHVVGADPTADAAAVRRRLGIVFQQPALDAALTVQENLRVQGGLYGLHGRPLAERLDALLAAFDLADRQRDRVGTLSGGLQRRVDLARGLLHRPALLLLDEPTTGLDPVARRAFWDALAHQRRREGTTVLVATHLLDEAAPCDAVAILDRGRLVAHGAPDALTAALGSETLWLETADAPALRARIEARFGVEARIVGQALQLSHADAPALLPALYDAFGETIESATVRKPTLDDVFLVHAGHQLSAHAQALQPSLEA
ncbi:MAG: ABC transporter ATP-binding protein [Rhodothermales bacterium]|nr:ABC transporter ATP-binding protein [Rhodothermales bacterium]